MEEPIDHKASALRVIINDLDEERKRFARHLEVLDVRNQVLRDQAAEHITKPDQIIARLRAALEG
jgi:hypothetical protein